MATLVIKANASEKFLNSNFLSSSRRTHGPRTAAPPRPESPPESGGRSAHAQRPAGTGVELLGSWVCGHGSMSLTCFTTSKLWIHGRSVNRGGQFSPFPGYDGRLGDRRPPERRREKSRRTRATPDRGRQTRPTAWPPRTYPDGISY